MIAMSKLMKKVLQTPNNLEAGGMGEGEGMQMSRSRSIRSRRDPSRTAGMSTRDMNDCYKVTHERLL